MRKKLPAALTTPHVSRFTASLRSLIDPRANQSDLLFSQWRDFVFVIRRWHVVIFVAEVRDIVDQHALGAVAGFDDFAVLPAFEGGWETVQPELAFLFVWPVAIDARLIEHRFDVIRVGHVLFVRGRRQFAHVHGRLVFVLLGALDSQQGKRQRPCQAGDA